MTSPSGQTLPPSPPVSPTAFTYPPVIVILTIIFLILFLIGFFSIYFCQCMQNLVHTWPHGHTVGGAAMSTTTNGVDPSIVQSFPLFTYSTVKDYRKETYGLECAICLLEFKPSNVLRLLTICCHVFHQECIDLWLVAHKTCPVCRRNLTLPMQPPDKSPSHENHHIDDDDDTFVSITIHDESENETGSKKEEGSSCSCGHGDEQSKVEKFHRSHTTGHSMLGNKDHDRFTLRLPEHVKSRILKGHNSSKSWSVFGEL